MLRRKKKVPSDMSAQQRLKSVCITAQSDQCIRYPNEETLHPSLSKLHPVKILAQLFKPALA